MKKIRCMLSALALILSTSSYALPTLLNEEVYIESFICGSDLCYLDLDIANIDNVRISSLCADTQYCAEYLSKWEHLAKRSHEDYPSLEIHRQAKVTLQLTENPYSGQKIYEALSIRYLPE